MKKTNTPIFAIECVSSDDDDDPIEELPSSNRVSSTCTSHFNDINNSVLNEDNVRKFLNVVGGFANASFYHNFCQSYRFWNRFHQMVKEKEKEMILKWNTYKIISKIEHHHMEEFVKLGLPVNHHKIRSICRLFFSFLLAKHSLRLDETLEKSLNEELIIMYYSHVNYWKLSNIPCIFTPECFISKKQETTKRYNNSRSGIEIPNTKKRKVTPPTQ